MSIPALLDERLVITPADHQSHRHFAFEVPHGCERLELHVRYAPKFLSRHDSAALLRHAVSAQRAALETRVGAELARRWASDFDGAQLTVPNLLAISLDDALGVYRGAGHRHTADQQLTIGAAAASPGLVPGPLHAGTWRLTLTAHTVISDQCAVEIQIGAVMASSPP